MVRSRFEPCASARSASSNQLAAADPADDRRDSPTKNLPSFCRLHADVVARTLVGVAGAGPSISGRFRYSFSSTSRNFSGPQSATRNFSRARVRSRR